MEFSDFLTRMGGKDGNGAVADLRGADGGNCPPPSR